MLLPEVNAQSESGPYKILFDEAHDQYYKYSNQRFKTAIDYLNRTFEFEVHLNKAQFTNQSILEDYDLIIIGNPGLKGNFSAVELGILKNYTQKGGNLFLLSNYNDVENPSPDGNLTGHASYLNNITYTLNLSVSFTAYDLHAEPPHIPRGERWKVEIEKSNFKTLHPIQQKLQTVLVFTSGLNITETENIIATGYSDSYLKNGEGNIINNTPWLSVTQYGPSRIVFCGSTAMFSDLDVNGTSEVEKKYTGVPWIEAVDNLRLWANLIQWVLIMESPTFFTIYIIVVCAIIAAGIGFYIFQSYYLSPKASNLEKEIQNLQEERGKTLKDARRCASEGDYLGAAKLYKQAARISNQLGDTQEESLYIQKHRDFFAKSKKMNQ